MWRAAYGWGKDGMNGVDGLTMNTFQQNDPLIMMPIRHWHFPAFHAAVRMDKNVLFLKMHNSR